MGIYVFLQAGVGVIRGIIGVMKTCSKCGEAKPLSDFSALKRSKDGLNYHCKVCWNESQRLHAAANRETYRARCREYYEKNREKHLAKNAKWRADNREKNLSQKREYSRVTWRDNPDKLRVHAVRRRAAVRGATHERVDLAEVLAAHGRVCHICREAIGDDLHYDHVIPISRGGAHSFDNLKPAHRLCNQRKGSSLSTDICIDPEGLLATPPPDQSHLPQMPEPAPCQAEGSP
jgi:5-methylcytosine-specific restriction endonuclease McrA